MQFTEKEINLAKQLKEASLEWYPQKGDWYFVGDGEVDSCIYGLVNDIYVGGMFYRYHFSHCTWLPLWHQCREVMLEKDWRLITLMDTPQQVEWRTHLVFERLIDKEVHCIETTGLTDLEAMYKALLEVSSVPASSLNEQVGNL